MANKKTPAAKKAAPEKAAKKAVKKTPAAKKAAPKKAAKKAAKEVKPISIHGAGKNGELITDKAELQNFSNAMAAGEKEKKPNKKNEPPVLIRNTRLRLRMQMMQSSKKKTKK